MPKKDKCPSCKCSETVTHNFTHDQGFLEETWAECKQCGRLKHHWSYGCLYIENWKDKTYPPLKYRIREFLKKLFRKKRISKVDINSDELPF